MNLLRNVTHLAFFGSMLDVVGSRHTTRFPLKHFALYLVSPHNITPRALCMLFDHVTQDSFTQTILHVVQSRHTIRPLFVVWSRHSSHFLLERVVRGLSVSHNTLSPKECCVTELHNSREL